MAQLDPLKIQPVIFDDIGDIDHGLFLQTRSFASLDGLRAISIIAVLYHHTCKGFPAWPITVRGFLGVDLFFVISGFLIVTLLLRERRRTGGIALRGFYARRFLRIFPAYYGVLALVACAAYLGSGDTALALRRDLPYALAYVSNLFPMSTLLYITWSLSTEEQFYLVVPTLEKYVGRAFRLALPALYIVVSLPPFGFLPSWHLPSFFRETTFGPILLGVMLAHVLDNPRGFRLVSMVFAHPLSPIAAIVLVLLASSHPAADICGWPRIFINWSLLALVASCVVRERHVLLPVLTLWPIRRIGIVSYGIYLFHLLVMHFAQKSLGLLGVSSQLLLFVATSLGAWLVAELSYRFFESRLLALKSRYAPQRRSTARPRVSVAADAASGGTSRADGSIPLRP
jgi:peptidoglycan/LPS O-acetylase OafA/YrhL